MKQRAILVNSFLAGAADLARHAALLDRINVFPVMDEDTGTNMTQTIARTVDLLKNDKGERLSTLPSIVGPCLLKSAQGNSGVILSQFLVGFFDSICTAPTMDYFSFLHAVKKGTKLAYASVSEPKEGTILTLMTDLGLALKTGGVIRDLQAHEKLEKSLSAGVVRTQKLMPVLAEAKVVDAGALGFFILASSLTMTLPAVWAPESVMVKIDARKNGDEEALLNGISDHIDPDFFLKAALRPNLNRRYCVNLLIDLARGLPKNWREPFEEVGESIDMARHGALIKLHMHSDDPLSVFDRAGRLGNVLEHSAEDMREQMENARESRSTPLPRIRSKYKVVSDSSMSLDFDMAAELNIDRIENLVNAHGKAIRDEDLDRNALFKHMRAGHRYTTAVTSPDAVRQFLDRHLIGYECLFYVGVGTAYTGTQKMVRKVVDNHPKKERISVFNTAAASGQQGLICLAAGRFAEIANSGAAMKNYIFKQITTCREYLVIDDLKYLSRSGRIGKVKAAVAGALSLKPIVGHGERGAITHAKVRSQKAALEEIIKRVRSHPGEGPMLVMIEYTDNRDWAEKVRDRLAMELEENTEIVFSPLSSTSAVHMGPGTWGVAVTRIIIETKIGTTRIL